MGSYDPKGREIITAFAKVMNHLGTSYGVLQKEKCTGDPARRLGNDLVFQQLAEANLETLKTNQVKKIVSICPHCVRTIAKDWSEYGLAPTIEHHSEFMARHQDRLPKPKGEDVVYHDPCYLGRYRGTYEEPRQVLGSPVEVPAIASAALLRRGRRTRVPGRRDRRPREPQSRQGTRRNRCEDCSRGLPLLQHDAA